MFENGPAGKIGARMKFHVKTISTAYCQPEKRKQAYLIQ